MRLQLVLILTSDFFRGSSWMPFLLCRVGGNVVNDFILGSIIFAVQHLNCSLVVVMAHSRCSVVASAVQNWARSKSNLGDEDEARSLAETVQKTLGNSPSLASQKSADTVFFFLIPLSLLFFFTARDLFVFTRFPPSIIFHLGSLRIHFKKEQRLKYSWEVFHSRPPPFRSICACMP